MARRPLKITAKGRRLLAIVKAIKPRAKRNWLNVLPEATQHELLDIKQKHQAGELDCTAADAHRALSAAIKLPSKDAFRKWLNG
jgi:hypothetical protein